MSGFEPCSGFCESDVHGYCRTEQFGESVGIEQGAFDITGANTAKLDFALALKK